jgi:hypothetical protein
VQVPCHAGEVAVGGGFANPDAPTTEVYDLQLIGSGWGGAAYDESSSAQPVTFYAECLTAPGAHVAVTSTATTTVAPETSGGTQVSCPAAALLSGGNFVGDKYTFVYNFLPTAASTWEVDITNETPSDYDELQVYAVCLSLG